jgi:Na+-driven multidrug efflux pump
MASMIVSILRQLLALVPVAWLLSKTGDVNMVWWAFPMAEIISLLASAYFLRQAFRDMEQKLSKPLEAE